MKALSVHHFLTEILGLFQASRGLNDISYWNKYWQQLCPLAIFNRADLPTSQIEEQSGEFGQVVQKIRTFYFPDAQTEFFTSDCYIFLIISSQAKNCDLLHIFSPGKFSFCNFTKRGEITLEFVLAVRECYQIYLKK